MSQAPRLLIVDDEPDLRWVLASLFRDHHYAVAQASDGSEALAAIADFQPHVVLSDVRMPTLDGVSLLRELHRRDPDLPVILLSAVEDLATAVGAMKDGAYDYLTKPFDPPRLLVTVQRAVERRRLRSELVRLQGQLAEQRVQFGASTAASELQRTVDLVAPQATLSVLIQGESGTGKEVVAREIHRRSPNADGPFVAVDCGALPEQLMESQLFGHRRGAFTGAHQDRSGLFRTANGGTLFLDELGNLPLPLQAKLLRALQERAVVPVGGGEPVPFQARLLCATNTRLLDDVASGAFRIDLYHRVAEFCIEIPPLRERADDALHFARLFLAEANSEMGRGVAGLTPAAEALVRAHPWPGNLRELRNAVRRAVLLCTGPELDFADLRLAGGSAPPPDEPIAATGSLTERIRQASEALEARILRETLDACGGNKAAAARLLQVDYTTLHRKLKRHRLLTMAPEP